MSKLPLRTTPEFLPAMSEEKDFMSWNRAVIDEFKDLPNEEIKTILKSKSNKFSVMMENWESDFNFASLVRNANAFNAKEVFYIGNKKVDRRGMIGQYKYTDVNWIENLDRLTELKKTYKFIGIDNVPGSLPLSEHTWEENSLLIFGSESYGLSKEIQSLCDKVVYIKQYGSVRSLNAAVASGIVMFDFLNRIKINANIGDI